jgi:hypothetical protein
MVLSVIVVAVILPVDNLVVCKPKRSLQQDRRTVSLRIMLILLHVNHFHPHEKFHLSIIGRQQKVTPRRCSYHHLSILQALPARALGLQDIEETRARTDDAHLYT